MKLGKHITLPSIPKLGLDAISVNLPDSALRRHVKIWKVPAAVSTDRYFISVSDAGAAQVVPPSRSKDNLLLVEYTMTDNQDVSVNYKNREVQNA